MSDPRKTEPLPRLYHFKGGTLYVHPTRRTCVFSPHWCPAIKVDVTRAAAATAIRTHIRKVA